MKDFFNKETLDNIKQFCAENKKYVGVAGVLVGLILILIVVVAGGNNGRQSNTEAGSQTEISVKDFEFEKDYTNDAKDDISTLLADYYKAYVGDDLDTLGKLATPMSDNEKSYIGVVSQYYESVNDITPYTKNGLKKGTYFVSVKNSIKFTGVDTQAPTLDFFYIETDKDGKLFINNVYSNFNRTYCENELDDDIMELISKYTASSEFADLHEEVQKAYEQAVGSDANLKTMLETTLTGAIKQWYTSSGIANLKKSDADTQTTEADTQQADDASQSGDQQTTDANAGQTADQQTTDANAGQTTDQQTTDTNAANQQTAEQPQAPAEYQVELFLDMAWNLEAVKQQGVAAHQRHFLEREFGKNRADRLQPVMQEAYRLAYIRKPEFMGNTRTEEKDPKFKVISDLPWSEQEINERLAAYRQLSDKVEQEWHALPAQKKETYFQLVKYPVQAAAQMNNKLLTAQLARHGKADWADSDRAYDSIVSLTKRYNTTKWNRMMDFQPRRLPVFNRVERKALSSGLPEKRQAVYTWNGADCAEGVSAICEGLGYEGKAVAVSKNKELTFEFTAWETDSVEVEVRLLPNHPVEGERLRFTISLDGSATEAVSYETKGRSEEWKENVLCNQAVRRMVLPVARKASHRLIFTALDEGVVLDQIYLYMPRIK